MKSLLPGAQTKEARKTDWHLPIFEGIITQERNWHEAQAWFKEHHAKAWENRAFILRHYFYPSVISQQGDLYDYCFKNEEEARKYLNFIKLLLADRHPDLIAHGNVIKTDGFPNTPYQFHLTKEQHQCLEGLRTPDSLIKSIRWDKHGFILDFILSVTKTDKNQPHSPLRRGEHKTYTVYGHGVFHRSNKPSPYPYEEDRLAKKKKKTSKHQSTSLVTAETQSPVFGHDKDRRNKLVGFIFDTHDAFFNRLFIYDGGTVGRNYEFYNKEDANDYYAKTVTGQNPILFSSVDEFKKAIVKHSNQYNEVLARLRFNLNTSCVAIFSDTFEARCVAQYYARLMRERLAQQYQELGLTLEENYQVPIIHYLPGNPKNWMPYTLEQQHADQAEADRMMSDENAVKDASAKKNYEFLLIATKRGYKSFKGSNALHFAAACGHLEIVKALLEKNANVDLQDNRGWAALHYAAANGHLEIVKALLEKNANVDLQDNRGWAELHFAAQKGHLEIVKVLLEKNADVNLQNNNGETALHLAEQYDHLEIVKALLEKNANVDLEDRGLSFFSAPGNTALGYAADKGHFEIAKCITLHNLDQYEKNLQTRNEEHQPRFPLLSFLSKGYSKTEKLAAINELRDALREQRPIDPRYLDVLKNGKLSRIFDYLVICGQVSIRNGRVTP